MSDFLSIYSCIYGYNTRTPETPENHEPSSFNHYSYMVLFFCYKLFCALESGTLFFFLSCFFLNKSLQMKLGFKVMLKTYGLVQMIINKQNLCSNEVAAGVFIHAKLNICINQAKRKKWTTALNRADVKNDMKVRGERGGATINPRLNYSHRARTESSDGHWVSE